MARKPGRKIIGYRGAGWSGSGWVDGVPIYESETKDASGKGSSPRNPSWTRDLLILALHLYFRLDFGSHSSRVKKRDPEIVALSKTLNRLPRHGRYRRADYRNPNGVYMKLGNFLSVDPKYLARGRKGLTAGARLDRLVWDEFSDRPEHLREVADSIVRAIDLPVGEIGDEQAEEAVEGEMLYRLHRYYERAHSVVAAKKARALRDNGRLPVKYAVRLC